MMNNSERSMKKFLLLWSGEFISTIGSGLSSFGLGVYIYQQTGKASAMALVTLLAFLPALLLSTVAGVLADRYDRRLLMMLGDSLSVIGLIFILICLFQGEAKLWQICLGVTISSIFSSLMEPAYRATVTDLLTEEQYTKASGLVQVANASKFLISPILAGFLLTFFDVKLLLILDICTFFVTVSTTYVVRNGLATKKNSDSDEKGSFIQEFKEGFYAISKNRGILALVLMTSLLTLFLGVIETLSIPMILSFSTSKVAGTLETVVAMGMLVSSVLMGVFSIKKRYVKMLSVSIFFAGIFMVGFGLRENLILISISGFLFFAMLPFANASLDYLVRTNVDNSIQGRAWSIIGIISQFGTVLAYAFSGVLADYVFTPLLLNGGPLQNSVGRIIGTGKGRGIGLFIILSGVLLCVTAIILYHLKSVRSLEKEVDYVLQDNL